VKPAPLRNLALKLGVPKEEIEKAGSLSLLACIMQMAVIAAEQGHRLPDDATAVAKLRNAEAKIPNLDSLFAMNRLRLCAAHAPSANQDKKIREAAAVFGIDPSAMAGGWGLAMDRMYERLTADLNALAAALGRVLK
jgi:hypothetical protein